MKLTKKQLDAIRNAKTKEEAVKIYVSPIEYTAEDHLIRDWHKPEYISISNDEFIELIKEKDGSKIQK